MTRSPSGGRSSSELRSGQGLCLRRGERSEPTPFPTARAAIRSPGTAERVRDPGRGGPSTGWSKPSATWPANTRAYTSYTNVSNKRLYWYTGSITKYADTGSFYGLDYSGSAGYAKSSSHSRGTFIYGGTYDYDYGDVCDGVVGTYRFTLRSAVKYSSIRISVLGRSYPGYGAGAVAVDDTDGGFDGVKTIGRSWGWHTTGSLSDPVAMSAHAASRAAWWLSEATRGWWTTKVARPASTRSSGSVGPRPNCRHVAITWRVGRRLLGRCVLNVATSSRMSSRTSTRSSRLRPTALSISVEELRARVELAYLTTYVDADAGDLEAAIAALREDPEKGGFKRWKQPRNAITGSLGNQIRNVMLRIMNTNTAAAGGERDSLNGTSSIPSAPVAGIGSASEDSTPAR